MKLSLIDGTPASVRCCKKFTLYGEVFAIHKCYEDSRYYVCSHYKTGARIDSAYAYTIKNIMETTVSTIRHFGKKYLLLGIKEYPIINKLKE